MDDKDRTPLDTPWKLNNEVLDEASGLDHGVMVRIEITVLLLICTYVVLSCEFKSIVGVSNSQWIIIPLLPLSSQCSRSHP